MARRTRIDPDGTIEVTVDTGQRARAAAPETPVVETAAPETDEEKRIRLLAEAEGARAAGDEEKAKKLIAEAEALGAPVVVADSAEEMTVPAAADPAEELAEGDAGTGLQEQVNDLNERLQAIEEFLDAQLQSQMASILATDVELPNIEGLNPK